MATGPKNKRTGAEWETRVLRYIRDKGWKAERLRLAGRDDEGDIAINDPNLPYVLVLEAKAPGPGQPIRLSEWVREAQREAENYQKARGADKRPYAAVVIKAPNKPVGKAYLVFPLEEFLGGV